MAGSYPDAPSRRFAYDEDGTIVLYNIPGSFSRSLATSVPPHIPLIPLPIIDIDRMNNEDPTFFQESGQNNQMSSWIMWMFAQKREIDGAFYNVDPSHSGFARWMSSSTDTTNGLDGTWNDLGIVGHDNPQVDLYRTAIDSMSESNTVAVMAFQGSQERTRWRMVHIYGTIQAGETPSRLIFLDPDNSDAAFARPLDFGDVPRGQTQVDTVKIVNNSGSLTANTVAITANDLFKGSNSWYEFSLDDVIYSATLALGNMGVGATQLVFVKQVVPDAQNIGLYAARARVGAASWT